jgi:signal transduction histidine kinase
VAVWRFPSLNLDRQTFRSRVARRVFLAFLVGALLPVTAFAAFSFLHVGRQLEDQARRQLRAESKAVGMALLDRLVAFETALSGSPDRSAPGTRSIFLRQFQVPGPQVPSELSAYAAELAPQGPWEHEHLAAGRSLLRVLRARAGTHRLFLVRASSGDGSEATVAAELDPARLWSPDALRADVQVAIVDPEGELLFATEREASAAVGADASDRVELQGEPHLREEWTLFLKSVFGTAPWTIVHFQPEAAVLEPLWQFRYYFVLAAVLSIWVVILLSIGLIRRSLVPIETLRAATQRLAARDFDVRVEIHTDDEFRDLGDAFNDMAERVGDLTRHLEDKVAARTRDLEDALTELQETQAQLVHQEKMASVGQFVAGIAHEINNPLSFIEGNLHFLRQYSETLASALGAYEKETAGADPELRESLAAIREDLDVAYVLEDLEKIFDGCADGVQRTTALVQDLRTFSRVDDSECLPVDLNEALDSTLNVLGSRLGGITLVRDYGNLPPVVCLAGPLNQVYLNRVATAADAVGDEGHITLRTRELGSEWVSIEVEDDGCGMPQEDLERIFDPFFTTKDVGRGTGLGLSVSYGIVQRHTGRIEAQSQPGRGTCFRLELPVVFRGSASTETDTDGAEAGDPA